MLHPKSLSLKVKSWRIVRFQRAFHLFLRTERWKRRLIWGTEGDLWSDIIKSIWLFLFWVFSWSLRLLNKCKKWIFNDVTLINWGKSLSKSLNFFLFQSERNFRISIAAWIRLQNLFYYRNLNQSLKWRNNFW